MTQFEDVTAVCNRVRSVRDKLAAGVGDHHDHLTGLAACIDMLAENLRVLVKPSATLAADELHMPTHAPLLDDSLDRLDKLIAANSPTDGSKRELAWHHLATIVREIGRQVAANATEPADSHPLPATVRTTAGPVGVGQMIRHAAAVSRLHIGAIVYNTTEVRDILGAENRHYFRHIARGHWMPCTSAGVVHVLPDFPDGFTSGQLFMPVHVYAV